MHPVLETMGVMLLAGVGMLLGAWFSRLPKPWWLIGFVVPLTLVVLNNIANHYPGILFLPALLNLMPGRSRPAVMGFLIAVMLTTLLSRLPRRRERLAVIILMLAVVGGTSVWPFLAPVFNQRQLMELVTKVDSDGICLQTTDYTCGLAASVTGLRRLGFKADEGRLAILSYCTPSYGAEPDALAAAMESCYGSQGLKCVWRTFSAVSDLKSRCPTIAVIKFNAFVDHYVAVLSVDDTKVVIGDPLNGRTEMTRQEFAEAWRFCGIALTRH
jgi:predicted double-glycine peptidase